MPTFKKMFGRGKKTAGQTKDSAGTATKKSHSEQTESEAGDCPAPFMKEDGCSKCEEMEVDPPKDENPDLLQAEKEGLQWPPPGVEFSCDQTELPDKEDDGGRSIITNESMTRRLEDEPSEVPSLYNTLETQFQQGKKAIVNVPTFCECQDPSVVFGIHQSLDQNGNVELTFSRDSSPSKSTKGLAEEPNDLPAESSSVDVASTSVSGHGSPERPKGSKRVRRHRREVPTKPEGDEAAVQKQSHTEGENLNPEDTDQHQLYVENEWTPPRHAHRQVVIKEKDQVEFPAPPSGLPEGEAGELKVINEIVKEVVSGNNSKPPSPHKSRRSKAPSLSLHRRKHSLENVAEPQVGETVTVEDGSTSSSDDVKRTQTLPALIRHVDPESKKRHSRSRKESSGSRERSGMKKLLAHMGSPLEETRSSGATTIVSATTDKDHEPSPSARPERTASLLGGWVKASRRKSSSVGPPSNGRSASASAVSGGSTGPEPATTVVSRTSSPFEAGVDLEHLIVELNKLQCEVRVLAENNCNTRKLHDSDVALMRQEVGTIVFEMTGLKGELEKFRREYAQADFQRKVEVMEFSQAILPITRTDRSSLTLHCCETAEQALNEQLARLHDEGPLVPYEGNDMPTMLARISHRGDDGEKDGTWGNRVGRGMGRTFVMVMTGLRQLWYFYLTMYPMI